jgi:hypothetical protein
MPGRLRRHSGQPAFWRELPRCQNRIEDHHAANRRIPKRYDGTDALAGTALCDVRVVGRAHAGLRGRPANVPDTKVGTHYVVVELDRCDIGSRSRLGVGSGEGTSEIAVQAPLDELCPCHAPRRRSGAGTPVAVRCECSGLRQRWAALAFRCVPSACGSGIGPVEARARQDDIAERVLRDVGRAPESRCLGGEASAY